MTTTVGGFQAVTVSNFTDTTNQYNAVCASRTYIWGQSSDMSGIGSTSGSGTRPAPTRTPARAALAHRTGATGTMSNTH